MNTDTVIVMLATFERTEYATRTIRAINQYLRYDGELYYYLADAGSSVFHHEKCKKEMESAGRFWNGHNVYQSPGHNWNTAMDNIFSKTDFAFRLEDDFELRQTLDITPYVAILRNYSEMGIVRLGGLPVGLDCRTIGYDGRHFLMMSRTTQYAYSGNPLIMHKRYWEHYGKYKTDCSPGNTELDYDARFRIKNGPEIIWPVDGIGGWGIFGHIGERKSI